MKRRKIKPPNHLTTTSSQPERKLAGLLNLFQRAGFVDAQGTITAQGRQALEEQNCVPCSKEDRT